LYGLFPNPKNQNLEMQQKQPLARKMGHFTFVAPPQSQLGVIGLPNSWAQ
jgi:hypothetical protein